jgi:uncharacterized RDD family membrane protein YckC
MAAPTQPVPPTRARPKAAASGARLAGLGARLAAWVIDWIVMAVAFVLLLFVMGVAVVGGLGLGGAEGSGATVAIMAISVALFVAFNILYFPVSWARGGQTPGMRAMAIRVVREQGGGPIDLGDGVLRLIGYWISFLALLIGFLWILVDKRRRGWADLLAGTIVVDA